MYCRDLLKKKKCESVEIISGPIFNSDKLSESKYLLIKNIKNIKFMKTINMLSKKTES